MQAPLELFRAIRYARWDLTAWKRISQDWNVLNRSGDLPLKDCMVKSVGNVELLIPATNARNAE